MNIITTILHLSATAAFSYLFYMQTVGMNILVFTCLLFILMSLANIPERITPVRIIATILYLLSGLVAGYQGSTLNTMFNGFCMMIFVYTSLQQPLSIITGSLYATYIMLTGFFISITQKLIRYINAEQTDRSASRIKWWYFLIPIIILLVFFILYRNTSGAFLHITNQIDLNFISPFWVIFTFIGYALLFGLFHSVPWIPFSFKEALKGNDLIVDVSTKKYSFYAIGVILFYSLNLLLSLVLISDIAYLFFISTSDQSLPYAKLIHQGIGSLLTSLVLAVFFILIWFHKKNANPTQNIHLKVAAVIWGVLNAVMIGTNVYKNWLYINAFGYTYLRIGVYFSLLIALLIILISIYKIIYDKNNWFMYRNVGISFVIVCFGFNIFNWDKIITKTNIQLYSSGKLTPDVRYLLELSPDCLPTIHKHWSNINPEKNQYLETKFEEKAAKFMAAFEKTDWRSRTWQNYSTYNYIKKIKFFSGLTHHEILLRSVGEYESPR